MKITAIKLQNVRGFINIPETELSKSINIFIGPNNSGKSTIINSIFELQKNVLKSSDITIGKEEGIIELFYEGDHPIINKNKTFNRFVFSLKKGRWLYGVKNNNTTQEPFDRFPEKEPNNLIYPYLSKRKVVSYSDIINESNTNSINGDFTYLYSKIDRLVTPQYDGNQQYIKACNDIIGLEVSTMAKGNGKQAVYFVKKQEHIPITAMGEGVISIVGLITDLCVAEDKIFLIEELENDIHPKALKKLLEFIIEKSSSNQFFISTHSNIVMKYLGGAENSKVFNITNNNKDNERPNLYISNMNDISDNNEEKRKILEELGYDLFDFDLWKGWLFLEESSAEVIIREYLIEWFVPTLKNKLRTFSTIGITNLVPKFDDFNKLFVFLHLEPTYKNKVWVLIDAGDEEKKIIDNLKEKYCKSGWNEKTFAQFTKHDFESYYPNEFQSEVKEINHADDKQKKRQLKKDLLDKVKNWIEKDPEKAKEEFGKSASEVIERLKQISEEINK